MDTEERSELGKRSRRAGKAFEVKVRKELESNGWIVARWTKKVEEGQLVDSKPKFNPYTRMAQSVSTGFPDFVVFIPNRTNVDYKFQVKLVECKLRGKLDKEEKEQARVYNFLGFEVIIASEYIDENGRKKIRFVSTMADP